MARISDRFVCQSCGEVFNKWQGKCDSCNEWNSILQEQAEASMPKGLSAGKGRQLDFTSLETAADKKPRLKSGIEELDRVLGGGFVSGTSILIGGDPGIGKSTILLQAAAKLALSGYETTYISGEEATAQISLRAERLGLKSAPVRLATANSLRDIISSLEKTGPPKLLVIDSIQTMFADNLDSAPGTVAQVRACSQELIRLAKKIDTHLVILLVMLVR